MRSAKCAVKASHSPLPRIRACDDGEWCEAPASPIYGAKYHSISSLDPIIFNTLNIFLYIKKINFLYLINVGQKTHTKKEHSKKKRTFTKNQKITPLIF